jgi:hypothetical protein
MSLSTLSILGLILNAIGAGIHALLAISPERDQLGQENEKVV